MQFVYRPEGLDYSESRLVEAELWREAEERDIGRNDITIITGGPSELIIDVPDDTVATHLRLALGDRLEPYR
ncbi:hypothetical protein LAZ40_04700 [Cereibacter sphaeroides]|uniref:hypothetical protein n=1 Tax=Cereibacter sphaeroides TaxID=1063 RepID=UPI001F19D821|nr:hypothetical protein [Cereibacter sphaeroides]MCE6958355.1 hypothetical protein [Cereibacter sphaeroides]MCE6972222.1 hypothetical protein [Cereibacter sphaeroides]